MTLLGVVYDNLTGEVRRIIVPDDDEQLAVENFTGHHESLLLMPAIDMPTTTTDEVNRFVDAVVRLARSNIK